MHSKIDWTDLSALLLLLLLSHFSSVRFCATPKTTAHQAPPSLGFSRREHWSGLPFPSPMHESEKWKGSRSVVSDSSWPYGLQPTRLLRPWDFPGKNTGVGCHFPLQGIFPTQGLNLSPALAGGFFTTEPPGKPQECPVPFQNHLPHWVLIDCAISPCFLCVSLSHDLGRTLVSL